MARSPHAFVRGSTERFYAWLEEEGKALPGGPPVWICGDCHAGNLGPLAGPEGEVAIMVRDFDQTVVGEPAHDLLRLALSLSMAAWGSNLSGVTIAAMLEAMTAGYEETLSRPGSQAGEAPKPVRRVLNESLRRRWSDLARERIADPKPSIPLGKHFWPLEAKEREAIEEAVATPDVGRLVTMLRSRPDDAQVRLADAAYWVKGCSSLGRLRYAAVVEVEGRDGGAALLDFKEAARAAAPGLPQSAPADQAARVVAGGRALSPNLGERMLAVTLMGRPMVVRELLPQDLKLEISALGRKEAKLTARFLAAVVGRAHGRQMSVPERRAWRRELGRNRSKSLDAPGWLWRDVRDLMAIHQGAYLDHCRRCLA